MLRLWVVMTMMGSLRSFNQLLFRPWRVLGSFVLGVVYVEGRGVEVHRAKNLIPRRECEYGMWGGYCCVVLVFIIHA